MPLRIPLNVKSKPEIKAPQDKIGKQKNIYMNEKAAVFSLVFKVRLEKLVLPLSKRNGSESTLQIREVLHINFL